MGDLILFEFERTLADRLGRRYCVAVGRGATAIYLALRALGRPGKVVVPAILCPSPASAVLYAGCEPVFCDVKLDDFTLDPTALDALARRLRDELIAVLPVHLYGHPADMSAIGAVARDHGLVVIEDAAQSLGGSYRNTLLGALGDMSVVSFGHTKIIDVGAGGAVLTDDPALVERLVELRATLPPSPTNLRELAAEYREVYYTLKRLADQSPRLHALFGPVPEIYRDMYLYGPDGPWPGAVLDHLPALEATVTARRERAELYRQLLDHPAVIHPNAAPGAAPWRHSFLVPAGRRGELVDALRADGIDVSTWYPSLHRWYRREACAVLDSLPNAERIEREIINLWVTPDVAPRAIETVCEKVNRILDREARDASR
jgi:dTDP-4-amino-4,6-dideoxygalactose transaminase